MNITDIRIRRIFQDGRLRALVSVTFDNDFAVHDIKVIDGPQRLFVAMPSRRDEQGTFRDICHPISAKARGFLETAVIYAYEQYMQEHPTAEKEEDEFENRPQVL
ncbi:MAG: septation regulator SpoVG [Oscillospiraceae bacterium]